MLFNFPKGTQLTSFKVLGPLTFLGFQMSKLQVHYHSKTIKVGCIYLRLGLKMSVFEALNAINNDRITRNSTPTRMRFLLDV
jgi:hypothetical protein